MLSQKTLQNVIVIDDEDESDHEMYKRQKFSQSLSTAVKGGKEVSSDNKVRNPVRRRKKKTVRVIRQVALKPKPPAQDEGAAYINNDVVNQVAPSVTQSSILKNVLLNESVNYQTLPVLLNTMAPTQSTSNNLAPTTLIFNNQPTYEHHQEMQMMTSKNFIVHNEGTNLMQNTMKTENNVVFMTPSQNSGGILTNMTSSLISVKEENGKQNCMLPISPKNVVLRSYLMNNDVNFQNLTCGQTLSTNENMVNSGFPVLNTVMTSQPLILNNGTVNCGIQSNMSQPSQIVVVSNIQPMSGNMQLISQPQTASNVLQNPNYVSAVQSNYQILTQPQTVNIINLSQVPNTNELVTQNLNNSVAQLNTMQTPTLIYTQPQCSSNIASQNIVNLQALQPQINSVPSSQMQQIPFVQSTNNSAQQGSTRFRKLKPNIKPEKNAVVNNSVPAQVVKQKIVETSSSVHFKKYKQKSAPYTRRGRPKKAANLAAGMTTKTRGRRKGDIDWNEISSSNIIDGERPRRKVREKINPLRVIEFSDSDDESERQRPIKEEKHVKEEEKEIHDIKLEVKEEVQDEELEWESMVIIENDIVCS